MAGYFVKSFTSSREQFPGRVQLGDTFGDRRGPRQRGAASKVLRSDVNPEIVSHALCTQGVWPELLGLMDVGCVTL